ncbi:ATP-binding protein [Caldimonas sp. KR1-144]|uniref:ATP-binding protein n=1 Tax=Caldimonas sp. KR1-144 TaxID=3400911 RepID=UPI003C013C09
MTASLRFASCEIRPAQRQLLVDGQPQALGARAFDVLLALVERRERVVTKAELLDLAWPGLVVEENNLQVQISALRKALGAGAIATVPGRGYQFTLVEDRPAAAPPAATAVTAPLHALPEPASTMLGREAELAMLEQALASERLLTVVGPGGMGKTRLAIEAAHRHAAAQAHGAAWVELAPLGDAALLPGAIAAAIGLELQGTASLAAVAAALRPLSMLLVLDNAEHLLESVAATAASLMRAAPGLRLLVTSQAPLRIDGEVVLRLDALGLPAPDAPLAEAARCPALALLVERARALDRRFALGEDNRGALIEICRRLDGLPLALQLAAARLPMLGAHGVARHLDERFKLLAAAGARDAAPRHLSLQAVIDWSHALLAPDEQRAWHRLGVFEASFSLEAAQAVLADESAEPWAAAERLATLVERSLVSADTRDPPRYALSETGRAYARAKAREAGEADALKARHAAIVRETFEAAPDTFLVSTDRDWLARFEPELEDLRAALGWAIVKEPATAAALIGAAAPLWRYLSLDDEARRWIDASASAAQGELPKPIAARWWRAAQWAWAEQDAARSREAGERAQALYRELGDALGLYAELTAIAGQSDAETAKAALDEALQLERPDWPLRVRAWGWRARADVARIAQDWAASREARAQELALRRAAGDERGALRAELHLAELSLALGDAKAAEMQAGALVERLRRERASLTLCRALLLQMEALLAQSQADQAAGMAADVVRLARDGGALVRAAEVFAWLAVQRGQRDIAQRLHAWAGTSDSSGGAPGFSPARLATTAALIESTDAKSVAVTLDEQIEALLVAASGATRD